MSGIERLKKVSINIYYFVLDFRGMIEPPSHIPLMGPLADRVSSIHHLHAWVCGLHGGPRGLVLVHSV